MGSVMEAAAVTHYHAWSAAKLASEKLPGPSAIVRMADDPGLMPEIFDKENVIDCLDLCFHDAEYGCGLTTVPRDADARDIIRFAQQHGTAPNIVAQCMAGIGRSHAVCKALAEMNGQSFRSSTYNRTLYRRLLYVVGAEPKAEPLVSLTVRVKYKPNVLRLFLLSVKAQRYSNWEVVAFTDGPNALADDVVKEMDDDRIRLIETSEARGRWGHPYRQMAFEQCRGEWIGTQNDDNYLTPGFIEQLVAAGESKRADVVACQSLHRYSAWSAVPPGTDLCAWIARAELVHKTPWLGSGFTADQEYFKAMLSHPGVRGIAVERPLVVKN